MTNCNIKSCNPTYTTTGNASGQWGSFSIAQTASRSQQCHESGGSCAPNPALPMCQSRAAGTLVVDPSYFALEYGVGIPVTSPKSVSVAAIGAGSMDSWYADIYEGEPGSGNEEFVMRVSVAVTCTLCE